MIAKPFEKNGLNGHEALFLHQFWIDIARSSVIRRVIGYFGERAFLATIRAFFHANGIPFEDFQAFIALKERHTVSPLIFRLSMKKGI
jgi:hypothetical protein